MIMPIVLHLALKIVITEGGEDMVLGDWSFRLNLEPLSWQKANDECQRQEGVLMETRNAHALSVASAVMSSGMKPLGNIWLGMIYKPGNWELVDSTTNRSYDRLLAAWPPGRPNYTQPIEDSPAIDSPYNTTNTNIKRNEDESRQKQYPSQCATIWATETNIPSWWDNRCGDKHSFICELDDSQCSLGNADLVFNDSGHDRCFKFVTDRLNWFQAQDICRSRHSRLAVVDTIRLHKWISKYMIESAQIKRPFIAQRWIALNRINWKWTNGDLVQLDEWTKEAPHEDGGRCVALTQSVGHGFGWINTRCNLTLPFICAKYTRKKHVPGHLLRTRDKGWDADDYCTCVTRKELMNWRGILRAWTFNWPGFLINMPYLLVGLAAGIVLTTLSVLPCCPCWKKKIILPRDDNSYAATWNDPTCLSVVEGGERPRNPGQSRPVPATPGPPAGYTTPLPSAPYEHTYESPYAYINNNGMQSLPRP